MFSFDNKHMESNVKKIDIDRIKQIHLVGIVFAIVGVP